MLKALGAFWMDYGAILTLIACALTMAGAGYTLFNNSSISTKAVDRTAAAEKSLSTEHKLLLERTADSKETMRCIQGAVSAVDARIIKTNERLIEASAERKIQYASLTDAQKKLADSAGNMGKFAEEFARIAQENARLKQEVQALRMDLHHMRQAGSSYSQEHEDEMEPDL